MILTLNELKDRITPVAKKYNLKAVYVFGSYARKEATENSDVDILIDRAGSNIKGMFDMGGLYNDLSMNIGKEIDLVTMQSLEQRSTKERIPLFVDTVVSERVKIYE